MEIFKLFGSILVDNDKANASISNTEGKAQGLMGKFSKGIGTVAKWGAAAVVAAGTAAVGIGMLAKPLVESAASAQALNAQFEQVFGDTQENAQKTVDELGDKFGMLPNRIKPAMTQMTSMFKGLGMETSDAMKTAEGAVSLVADAAAFYDMAFEDANSALNSFIKGNYEGGEAIGLFANETQMAAWASKNLEVDWKKLDEAGKQVARLEFAKSMQEAAGATGQAARESNSYENQIGNLKQAWQDLKARLGEPILEPAVNGIKWLADVLSNVNVDPVIEGIERFVTFVSSNINPMVDGAKGKFGEFKQAIMDAIGFLEPYVVPIFEIIVAFIKDSVGKIVSYWQTDGQQLILAVQNAFNMIWSIIQFVMPAVLFLIQSVWGNIKGVISGALDIIMGLLKIFTGIFTGDWGKMLEGIKQLLSGALTFLWNLFSLMMIGKLIGGIKAFISSGIGLFKSFGTSLKGTFSDFINNIINLFGYFRATGSSIWRATIDTVRNIISTFVSAAKSNFSGLWTSIKSTFNNIKTAITSPIQTAKNTVKGFIGEIKGFFTGLRLQLPKIKMPKFTIKNWSKNPVDWLKAMPTLGVSWHAKGALFTKPTIFNTPSGLRGFGEAGPEAAIPLTESVLSTIGSMIARTMPQQTMDLEQLVQAITALANRAINLQVDGKTFAQLTGDYTDAEGGTRIRKIQRGLAT